MAIGRENDLPDAVAGVSDGVKNRSAIDITDAEGPDPIPLPGPGSDDNFTSIRTDIPRK